MKRPSVVLKIQALGRWSLVSPWGGGLGVGQWPNPCSEFQANERPCLQKKKKKKSSFLKSLGLRVHALTNAGSHT